MKKLFVLLPLAMLLFSCASAPQKDQSGKALAEQARSKALSVKADIAAKNEFAAAQAAFDEAAGLEATGDANAKYQEAERLFTAVYESVKAKRDAAQKELDAARTAIKEVENEAAELDRLRGGNQ
jgi:gamma-glutamyl:cysteine ligase YbdK (ATP-grasp superfamily)